MDIILLYDENDNETEFEVVATLEVDENDMLFCCRGDDTRDPDAEKWTRHMY